MPKKYAKRRPRAMRGGKRRVVRGRRRLSSVGGGMAFPSSGYYQTPESAAGTVGGYSMGPVRGRKKRAGRSRAASFGNRTAGGGGNLRMGRDPGSQIGKNTVAPLRRGKKFERGTNKRSVKRKILEALTFGANPILKADVKAIPTQLDWASGTQAVVTYVMCNSTPLIEQKLAKMKDASYFATSGAVAIPNPTNDVASSRMVVYPGTYIYNLKNTCTHTCYIECRVFKAVGFHSISMAGAWPEALTNDNVVQNTNAVPYTTEETVFSLHKRPDFRSPYLNTRYKEIKSSRGKWVLEPGQETRYVHKIPGFTFDQARFNVQVLGQDPSRCPYTYEIQFYCHAEMVTGLVDTDVCPGSGHIAINTQSIESWQAMPIVKKYQNLAEYGWGAIADGDQEDINDGDIVDEPFRKTV